MNNFISYIAREVKALGLNKKAFPNEQKIKEHFFQEDYENLSLLKNIHPFSLSEIKLLYPGAGTDILFLLHYLDYLFPQVTAAYCTLVDKDNNLPIIKTILDDIGIPFSDKKNQILFYWKGKLITVEYVKGDIFKTVDQFQFNVYFERAFRIMKSYHPDYEPQIFTQLDSDGIIISDSGFDTVPLQKINVPQELSSYGEMIMGVKK